MSRPVEAERAAAPGSAPGSALVLALWLALLLGVTGTVVTRLAAGAAGAAQVETDLARARAAAEGGIWAAAHRLANLPRDARPPVLEFMLAQGGIQVGVRAVDEDGRLDLNAAPEPLLVALFQAAGQEAPAAVAAAARVVAWREPNRGPGDAGPIRSVSELGSLGLPLTGALREVVTVHTGRAQPAPETAPPALRGLLAAARTIEAPVRGLRTPQAEGAGTAGRRSIWRIEAAARQGGVVARAVAVVAVAPAGGMPGRVLEWQGSAP